jgi:O-antigen ligase
MSLLSQSILLLIIISLGFNYSIIQGYVYLANIAAALISLILIANLKVSQIIDEKRNIIVLALLIFYILMNLNSFEGLKWIYLFIMYYSFSIYFRYFYPSINHILWAYLVGIFLGTISSFQFIDISLLGYNVLSNEFRGSIDALGGFNTFGLLAAIAIIIAIHFQNIYKNTFLKILLYIPIIFLFYAEISTLSRGGFFTLLVALFFYNFFNRSMKVFFGYMLVTLVGISLISLTIDIRNLLDRYLFYDDYTGSGRTEIWAYILSLMNNPINILFGYGAGPLHIDTNVMTGSSIAIYAESAHNTYLEIFYQFGILGLSLFLMFLFNISTSLNNIKDTNDKIILKTIFFALLCSMFFDSYFFSLQVAAIFSLFYATFNYGGLDEKFT